MDAGSANDLQSHPELVISLEGVHVVFPEGWWDDPSNDLIGPRGRLMIDERIDGLALIIAGTLRKLLKERRPASTGLIDPSGQPIQAGSTSTPADGVATLSAVGAERHRQLDG